MREQGIRVDDVSLGSTPTVEYVAQVEGVTEIRPGTYVFYDRCRPISVPAPLMNALRPWCVRWSVDRPRIWPSSTAVAKPSLPMYLRRRASEPEGVWPRRGVPRYGARETHGGARDAGSRSKLRPRSR
jgi:hypothetical protein